MQRAVARWSSAAQTAAGSRTPARPAPGPPPSPDTVLTELALLGRAVAAHFGRPQDVEWAYAGGRIWLVQARPMTALPPAPLKLSRLQRRAGLQLMDYMSVRPYPLDMSGWVRPGIGRMVERMLSEIAGVGVDIDDVLPERDGVVEQFMPPAPAPLEGDTTGPRPPARSHPPLPPGSLDRRPEVQTVRRRHA